MTMRLINVEYDVLQKYQTIWNGPKRGGLVAVNKNRDAPRVSV